jgi:hypothetical protein
LLVRFIPGTEKLEDFKQKLEFLHDRSTRLLQWIITEDLHKAMEPEEV